MECSVLKGTEWLLKFHADRFCNPNIIFMGIEGVGRFWVCWKMKMAQYGIKLQTLVFIF
jgi:hypothetical protein